MKKREWDKDIFNYDKAREWLRKNHLPVLFFLAILAIPILLIAVRYAVTHFPAISDTAIANKLSKNSVDFVTPALYYFSSIAQTMGAIIGLALAAMYAIMPNIRSSKDNPAFEPARRLLQRDEYFRRSINVGSVCILVSIVGLLFIYMTASSQSWAFVLLLFLGVTALGLGVYSLGTMFYFIRARMPKYFSPVEILEFAFGNGDPNKVRAMNERDVLDFAEICLFLGAYSKSNLLKYKYLEVIVCYYEEIKIRNRNTKFIMLLNKLENNISADIDKIGLSIQDYFILYYNIVCITCNSLYFKENTINLSNDKYTQEILEIFEFLHDKFTLVFENTAEDISFFYKTPLTNQLYFDGEFLLFANKKIINLLFDVYISITGSIYIMNIDNSPLLINLSSFLSYKELLENIELAKLIRNNLALLLISILNLQIFTYEETHDNLLIDNLKPILKYISKHNLLELYIPKIEFLYHYLILFITEQKPYIYSSIKENDTYFKSPKEIINVDLLSYYLDEIDFKLYFQVYKKALHPEIKSFKNFIYCHFIPYLERHGININDNPEYMAIIRRRIKEIKETEPDF